MKIFKSKSLSKKLILAMLVVIFLGLIKPNVSNAEATEAAQGGKLSQPVVDLVLTIGDGLTSQIPSLMISLATGVFRMPLLDKMVTLLLILQEIRAGL